MRLMMNELYRTTRQFVRCKKVGPFLANLRKAGAKAKIRGISKT